MSIQRSRLRTKVWSPGGTAFGSSRLALAWFSARRADFRFVQQEPLRFASSEHVLRGFCPQCGTTLTFEDARWPEELDIATASLDDPEAVPPGDHTFVRSRLGWMNLHDGLPEYPTTRSAGK
ncbi:MAG: GFA family protein [Lysobacteraceae bacterium]|nr:MAG: GFA family protein [Xanthomonadaceae bacterium]